METYLIDSDKAYTEFIEYLQEEKPEKEFPMQPEEGTLRIHFKDFKVEVLPEYRTKLEKLLESEFEASKGAENADFNINNYKTEVIENQGYKFRIFV